MGGRVWGWGGRGEWGGRYWGGGGGGMMGVYLKHGDPVAEGCLGAGMNKTLMAHKTQRPLLRAQLHSVYSCWARPIRSLRSPNTESWREREREEKQRRVKGRVQHSLWQQAQLLVFGVGAGSMAANVTVKTRDSSNPQLPRKPQTTIYFFTFSVSVVVKGTTRNLYLVMKQS